MYRRDKTKKLSKVFHNPPLTRKKHSRDLDHPVPRLRVENYVGPIKLLSV